MEPFGPILWTQYTRQANRVKCSVQMPTMTGNVAIQDPDLLFFAGDPIYESHGGYGMPVPWVNAVERTQTAHRSDPVDPAPLKGGIGVYFTRMTWGGVPIADGKQGHAAFSPGRYDEGFITRMMENLSRGGFKTVRTFLSNHRGANGIVTDARAAEVSPAYLRNLVHFLRAAQMHGIRVILSWDTLPTSTSQASLSGREFVRGFPILQLHSALGPAETPRETPWTSPAR